MLGLSPRNLRDMCLIELWSLIFLISFKPTNPYSLLEDACDCNSSSTAKGIIISLPFSICPASIIFVISPSIIILVSKTYLLLFNRFEVVKGD
jgi:hypothetical protein